MGGGQDMRLFDEYVLVGLELAGNPQTVGGMLLSLGVREVQTWFGS